MFLNAFRNLFASKTTNKLSKKGISRRLELLGLEERVVPATFTVVNNSDSGAGSLRQAIIDANATVDNDIIDFNFATGSSPYTITLATALPSIATTSTAGTLTITGLGASSLTISGSQGGFRIFSINTGGNLTISGVTVSGANTSGNGGAFNNSGTLSVSNSTISGNTVGDFGGGIFNNGTLNIANSTLSGNSATFGGGTSNNGTATVSNSTLYGNSAIKFGGGIDNSGTLSVSNSTISGNSTTDTGGGIYNSGTLSVSNSTLSGNTAVSNGGGIYNSSTLNIANTIIANSTNGGDYAGGGIVNLTSPSTAANNLVSQGLFTWATTKTSAEINLGTLANNGGPTQTLALLTGSVAIATGNATISNAAPVNGLDQRGYTRSSTAPSIGAYEFNGIAPATAPTVNSISPTSGSNAGGTSITITGTDFTGATAVTIGGTAATNLVVNSATSITVTTPAGTAGTASVLVTTPGGTNAANTLFTYLSAANTPTSPPVFSGSSTLNAVAGSPVSVQVAAAGFPAETNSNLFTNDFSAALPTSWTISDSASLTGGILQLTPASNNSRGIVTLPAVGATSPTGFSARFKLIVNNAGGAEGLSFNYGELLTGATLTGTAALETGMVSAGLVVTFGEFGDDRMEVRYNNKILSQVYVSFVSAAGKPVDVTVTPLGLLTLTVDGKTITTVNLGADYVAAAKSTWQFAFAARTGTSNSQHAIDDLTIDALQIAYGTTANYVDSTFGAALPTGWNTFGNGASLDTANNEFILTPNAGSRAGALVLPALGATSPTAFSAQFDYRASDGSGANGTSFNYGVIPATPTGSDEGIATSGLVVQMTEFGTDRILIKYDGTTLATGNVNLSGPFRRVSIDVAADGAIAVSVNGTVAVSTTLPAGYLSATKTAWQFAFGSKTGGSTNKHSLRNLSIARPRGLPAGLALDPVTGRLSGTLTNSAVANYPITLVATNTFGATVRDVTLANGPLSILIPTVTSIAPTSGSTAGGTSITITGTDFTGATAVTIGGNPATNLVVNSATSITVTTPAGIAGTASVLVTTPGGTNAANTLFTYNAPIFPGAGTTPAVPLSPAFPHAISINTGSGAVTDSASFTVIFNQSVTGVDATDFNLVATGTVANGIISSIAGSGANYTVNVTGITGVGSLGLNLVDLPTITALSSFAAQATFAAGTTPTSVTLGDVNGDGKLDIITTNVNPNSAGVLLGNGNGTFQIQATFATGDYPTSVKLGDVNGDGKLDIITANRDSDTVSVLLGNGNGTFVAQFSLLTGVRPGSVTLGDVNGDGRLDIIADNYTSNTASVLLGNGNGTFQTQATFATGTNPLSVTLGDVNGDGRLDIITANPNSDTVSVLLGNGNGTFQTQVPFATGTNPRSVTLGDVNGDGRLDIITANQGSQNASVLLGNGNGTFGVNTDFTTGSNPVSVILGDINGDGRLDIITANRNSYSASVLLGNGNGTFQTQATFATGTNPFSVTLGDVNGDGRLDIITANNNSNNASVLLGTGGSAITATFSPQQTFAAGTSPFSVALGDVNGDGILDIVTANYGSDNASVLLGNGNGTFQTEATFPAGDGTLSVTLGDVNGDGKLDIITGNNASASASVLLGNGDGTFAAQSTFATGTYPRSVTLGDVNGDGVLDIINASYTSANASVLLGNGNGTFAGQSTFAIGSLPNSVTLGDVNGDGILDIITANYGSDSASVLLGNGSVPGDFDGKTDFATGDGPFSVTLGDVNGDGKLDITTANFSGSASVLLGNGNGTFAATTNFATGNQPRSVALGDVNGDGRLDIITANTGSYNSSVLLGNGDGTFQSQKTFGTGGTSRSVGLGDVNRDGRLDMIFANNNNSTTSVLLNSLAFTGQTATVAAAPTVTSNTSNLAATATTLIIAGTGFDTTAANNTVTFSSGTGTVTSATATQLTVTFVTAPSLGSLTAVVTTNAISSGSAVQVASVVAGTATQVTLTTPAAGSASGSAFTTQPVITIQDALGNTVTNSTASVTMTVSGNGITLGTTTVNAVAGVATFTDVGISGTAGTAYTLTFTSGSLTTATQSITPTFGTATQATLSTNAAGSASGSAFTTQPVITIQDAFGNTVTNSTASVTMTVNGNGTTVGTATINAVAGVATFTDVGISGTAGTAYTLTFTSGSLTTATQSITPTFGTATQATLSTNAAGSVSGLAFTTQPVITIQDAFGNTVTNSSASVTMTVSGNGTTVGTTTVNAVAGVATFTDVGISGTAGTAYTLTFTSGSLTTATQSITPLGVANTPTFGTPTSTPDGFTVQISNYDANFTYGGTATVGSVSISGTGLVTVSGVAANTSSTATITTTQTNFISGSGQVTATSLAPTAPLVVGTPPATSSGGSSTVTLYDPATGAEAGTAVPFPGFSGPVKVVSGDFNGDGVAEIIAGAGFGGGPAIAIIDSQTGQVMEAFFAFDQAFTGGIFVAVQDTNSDGILDIIASAGPGGGPEVRIFDGSTLNVLRSFYAYAVDFTGGVSVASTDFNNDGILDLVTGAGPGGGPHVKVFDGATNAIISQWYAYATDFTGGVFVAAGDIGNDGTFEVVTGAGAGGSPVVAVWDPSTGALLAQFMAYAEDFTGGVRVGINDGNTDGIADILTGAGPGGGPQVNVFNFPALDLLFSFYSGDPANTGGVFVG